MSRRGPPISAFAALSSADDDEVIGYEQSDEDPESVSEQRPVSEPPELARAQPSAPVYSAPNAPVVVSCSKFVPTSENVVYGRGYVVIGLKADEFLMVKGQYTLKIQRGAVQIDSILYHSSHDPVKIYGLSLSSIPLISAAQVTDQNLVEDTVLPETEHLFTPNYKSVIRLDDVFDGLEKLGLLYPQLKNIHPNREDIDEFEGSAFAKSFYPYSFKVVENPSNNLGTYINKTWKNALEALTSPSGSAEDMRVLVIGAKNTGKSTFLRLLLNKLAAHEHISPKVLDIDPGQPEYSLPDCISLTTHHKPIHGQYFPFLCEHPARICYIGFNTPQRQPIKYISQLKALSSHMDMENGPLLINSPGWIKGFGVEILKELTDAVRPTHLVYLSFGGEDDNQLLCNLTYENLVRVPVPGFNSRGYDIVRYSPSQIRNFRMLSYFHYNRYEKTFDFEPLLARSPYKISYADFCDRDALIRYPGLSGISILDAANINHEDLVECLETQVVAIFELENEEFINLYDEMVQRGQLSSLESYPNLFNNTLESVAPEFRGLALIHSVNTTAKYINLYTPIDVARLSKSLASNETKLVLVKGRSDLPTEELIPKMISKTALPYVTYAAFGKGAKSVNVRRNVQRKTK
ncbi:hypothetical protein KL929_001366 [Ogataea haglerorum]|nr:hypothetical protein KL910_000888 [Ogataea haglerorum]KAG7793044.1 hypothetical protein KL945_000149 [Ogataea haglerorum]KAG7799289.1 hypothetical protein KL929_001366 [Ogataea haglerorum]KAG7803013.1 hypothetical protein KL944_001905 [Ogataea haglerorum]